MLFQKKIFLTKINSFMQNKDFNFTDEKFEDIQMLRYRLDGFDNLNLKQKKLIYYLSKAALWGRDITFDQFGRYNFLIRQTLETVYLRYEGDRQSQDFKAFEVYLKRIWFSNGIYHHYGEYKIEPGFSAEFFKHCVKSIDEIFLPLTGGQTADDLCKILEPIIFDSSVLPVKVNKKEGEDLILTSACNFYEGVTQDEVEKYYADIKNVHDKEPLSYGLNSTLRKTPDGVKEDVWYINGKYGFYIRKIVFWLEKALSATENDVQKDVIQKLIDYYKSGNLRDFNTYCIKWLEDRDSKVDFINGFIEVYDDPLGMRGTWEGLVEYIDEIATKRTKLISNNAQWFEDHSPIDDRFKKKKVKGVSAHVICAAMLGGAEYPSTAIGINLPNADWIRAQYGSKSVTISNIIYAYNEAAKGNKFAEEFVIDDATRESIKAYGDLGDAIHTDLHECLGHGSGQMLPGVDVDSLKAYGNTIEEARADLFGLYYAADRKLVDLGLFPNTEAYKATYYSYIMNGLLTQLARIEKGHQIEEAHMRNRALISRWCYDMGKAEKIIELVRIDNKTYVRVNSYEKLRVLFAKLLSEIQRIKSEGDFNAARNLVETYAVKVDPILHEEICERYKKLHIPPYKGFINPMLVPIYDNQHQIKDIRVDYSETYDNQMLRYSKEYSI